MMKTAVISLLVVSAISAEILEFDNNLIEFGDIRPAQTISLPYPYHAVESVAAPVYGNSHGNIPPTSLIVPVPTEVEPAGFFSTAISCTFDAVKAVLVFFLTNGPALIAGTVVALGVCKFTSLCDSQVTIYEAQKELRSLATPERLSRAAKFVREAVKKYSEIQKN